MKSLFEFYLKDFNQLFNGWDFSYITSTGRMQESPLPWSYTTRVLKVLREAKNMLDMGTKGGDFTCAVGRDPNTDKPYICERFKGAFDLRYDGVKGSIYVLPGENFMKIVAGRGGL